MSQARVVLCIALAFILCCLLAAMAASPPEGPSPTTWPSYPGDNTVVRLEP